MAHNFGQVKTPRVYLDINNYLLNSGFKLEEVSGYDNSNPELVQQFLYLDPYTNKIHMGMDDPNNDGVDVINIMYGSNAANFIPGLNVNYLGFLSHEIPIGKKISMFKVESDGSSFDNVGCFPKNDKHLNVAYYATNEPGFKHEGFGSTIMHFTDNPGDTVGFKLQIDGQETDTNTNYDDADRLGLGAISIGEFIDLPQSPDLNVTMERRNDSLEQTTTISGKVFTRSTYGSPSFAHGEQPFGIYNNDPLTYSDGSYNALNRDLNKFKRTGRRVWSVSFSMIGADDVFHAYESGTLDSSTSLSGISDETEGDISSWIGVPVLTDSPIFKLYTYTKGFQLPFIWMADNNDASPNGFCVAKIDGNSFTVTQEAFERYSFSFDVVECF